MKTTIPLTRYARYLYTNETMDASARIADGTISRKAQAIGLNEAEPIIVVMDSLLRYAANYKTRFDGPLAEDYVLGPLWLDAIKSVRGLLDGDGAIAMLRGITTDTKDNGACEAVFWKALEIAGYGESDL